MLNVAILSDEDGNRGRDYLYREQVGSKQPACNAPRQPRLHGLTALPLFLRVHLQIDILGHKVKPEP
jgi:hypothetical protein